MLVFQLNFQERDLSGSQIGVMHSDFNDLLLLHLMPDIVRGRIPLLHHFQGPLDIPRRILIIFLRRRSNGRVRRTVRRLGGLRALERKPPSILILGRQLLTPVYSARMGKGVRTRLIAAIWIVIFRTTGSLPIGKISICLQLVACIINSLLRLHDDLLLFNAPKSARSFARGLIAKGVRMKHRPMKAIRCLMMARHVLPTRATTLDGMRTCARVDGMLIAWGVILLME